MPHLTALTGRVAESANGSSFPATMSAEIGLADGLIAARLATDQGYRAIQQIPGIGPV